jgi:hypothetical protein
MSLLGLHSQDDGAKAFDGVTVASEGFCFEGFDVSGVGVGHAADFSVNFMALQSQV